MVSVPHRSLVFEIHHITSILHIVTKICFCEDSISNVITQTSGYMHGMIIDTYLRRRDYNTGAWFAKCVCLSSASKSIFSLRFAD